MGTARRGSELRSLGTCHVLTMDVPGLGEIKVRPTVLPELSHEFNIGAGCLSSNRLSLDFGGSTPRLRGPKGTAQLINVIREPDSTEEPSEFPVTIANDQTLQPREVSKVEVSVSIILINILEIDIVGGIFRTRFVIDRQWFDPPLSYRNLDKDYRINLFSSQDFPAYSLFYPVVK